MRLIRSAVRRHPILAGAFLTLALGLTVSVSWAQQKAAKPAAGGDRVLGVVNGHEISESAVREKANSQLKQLTREFEAKQHEIIAGQLDMAIQNLLLDAEAAARGVTKEQLLADIKAPEVTDAEMDAFYEEHKAQIQQPKEQIAGQLRQYLQQRDQAAARQKLFDGLAAKYKAENRLEPLRTEVAGTGPAKGPEKAPVTIVEFSDFQCPYCRQLAPELDHVKAKYGNKVRIVFRHFPQPFHPNAEKAAEAALCAGEQGKFWEMHDAMFNNQEGLAVDGLKSKAAAIGLKPEPFNSCLDAGKYVAAVQADRKDGNEAGVNAPPAMFINGIFINGLVPIDQITSVVDDELRRKGSGS